jgi:hypothetical protein
MQAEVAALESLTPCGGIFVQHCSCVEPVSQGWIVRHHGVFLLYLSFLLFSGGNFVQAASIVSFPLLINEMPSFLLDLSK